jgi:tetratricopeptide (TPR) repeat protein
MECERRRCTRIRGVVAACVGLWLIAAPVRGQAPTAVEQAVALYDQGRYAEARPILEQLDDDGMLTGPLLYRLSYVLAVGGDTPGQQGALRRAVALLEQELSSDATLESAFYLANSLRNLNRAAEAREVALRAIERAESGSWQPSTDPVELFRLAKLYADVGRQADAALRYRQTLERLEASPDAFPIYVRWARRFLAELAFNRGDYDAVETELTALEERGMADPSDWDRLAVARARLGNWPGAAAAWRAAEAANPADADRPRYCRHLATLASGMGALPELAPDGRPWSALSKPELEALMKTQADIVKNIQAALDVESVDDETFAGFEKEVGAAKTVFVSASLEYALRKLPIRETAFFGGYAPLIFHAQNWELLQPGE